MAVAYVSTKTITPATGTGNTSSSWSVPSAINPAIIVYISTQTSCTVSAVSWSLGSGTTVQVAATSFAGSDTFSFIWKIPAPVAGSGTFTVLLSTSVPYQISADLFSGADQSDPSPNADADTDTGFDGVAFTLTPTNVAATDAMAAMTAHTQTGDSAGWTTGTTSYENNTTVVNMLTGYTIGSGSMTSAALSGGSGSRQSAIGVRVQAAPPSIALVSHMIVRNKYLNDYKRKHPKFPLTTY